ncbi:MAG: pantetheine-phosphate adenylyltransferase [Candidatus Bathyarchaeota archaeon]|jgi:pantetheine-phosphate adenylyltransferase
MQKKFKTVAVGGTFDEFHKGHRTLLTKAFEVGEKVLIGISSDKFAERMNKPHATSSYKQRFNELMDFLCKHQLTERAEIIQLNDSYGITLSKGCIEALIVSKETETTARKINEKRREMGMPLLQIVVIDMVPSENHFPISTTRIYWGEIDREGHLLSEK